MDGNRFSMSGQPAAKRMRSDRANSFMISDGNPSKTPYSLETCLQKVQHLLRKPVKLECDENAESVQNEQHVNQINTTPSLENSLQKIKHLLRNPAQAEHVEKSQPVKQNEKYPLPSDRTFLIDASLRKVQHLLRKPPKFEYDKMSEPTEEIDDSDPRQNLMVLIDDCLMEIFDYLKPIDLANVAYVNVRLNKLVKRYIQIKNKIKFVPTDNSMKHARINVEDLRAFLCIFGAEIHSLTLHRALFDDTFDDFHSMARILSSIQEYCHLEKMTLIGFGMCGLMQSFFKQLKSLTLDGCSVTRSWNDMKQLTTLKLNEVIFRRYPTYGYDREFRMPPKPIPIPFDCFGALEKVQLTDVNVNNDNVIKLIKSNRKLKSLSIIKCYELSAHICIALSYLNQLVEFEFKTQKKCTNNFFDPLTSLKKLKILKLTHHDIRTSYLVHCFVANGVTLEHLELGLTRLDNQVVESIAKMQSIKILKLNEMAGMNESHIMSIAKQLKSLEELNLKTNSTISQNGIKDIVRAANRLTCLKVDAPGFMIDNETYKAILVTIQERGIQSKLELTIYGYGNQLAVPSEILNGPNKKWLTVKELNRNEHHLFESLASKVGPPPPQRSYYSDSDDDSDYYDDY